jgi:hypothetical protein
MVTPISMAVVNWRALALKRLAHLDELRHTGRWQRHFANRDAFEKALQVADADAERWKQLAYRNAVPLSGAAE